MKKFKKQFFEKRTSEERKKEINEKISGLKKKIAEITPEQLAEFSKCWVTGRINGVRSYTFLNHAFASFQLKKRGLAPTVFAPFKFWKEKERWVKSGEKAVYVFAPRFVKANLDDKVLFNEDHASDKPEKAETESTSKDEYMLRSYRLVPVFDYNQTEGKELEAGEYVTGGLTGDFMTGNASLNFKDIVPLVPFQVETYKFSNSGENGWTNGFSVHILEKDDDRAMVSTLIHEWAHAILHFEEDRKKLDSATKEVEAETVAFVVCDCLGIESLKAPLYLAGWSSPLSGYELVRVEKVILAIEKILTSVFLNSSGVSETSA